MKRKISTIFLSIVLVLAVAGPAAAVTWSNVARHYNFTEGFYSYIYSKHQINQVPGHPEQWYCTDKHIQRLGGIGLGKLVSTGSHSCNYPG